MIFFYKLHGGANELLLQISSIREMQKEGRDTSKATKTVVFFVWVFDRK